MSGESIRQQREDDISEVVQEENCFLFHELILHLGVESSHVFVDWRICWGSHERLGRWSEAHKKKKRRDCRQESPRACQFLLHLRLRAA